MKNELAVRINKARRNGVSNGIEFMGGVILITLNNIAEEYMDEDKVSPFLKETEQELNRIYKEVMDSVPSGEIDEMAEKIVYHVQDIRRKRGMDESL